MSANPFPSTRRAESTGPSGRREASPSARRVLVACCLIAGAGLVLIIAGSFLPWVVSGSVRRSSYAVVGIIDHLGVMEDGAIGVLVRAWPLIGVLCMAPVLAGCLRWWRTAGVLAVLIGFASGVLAFGVLLIAAGRGGLGIRLDPIGPAVMASGAVLLLLGGGALASKLNSPVRRAGPRPNRG